MVSNLCPKGMRDFLPSEKLLRNKIENIIRKSYLSYGFEEIETSMIENLENLSTSDAGENTKLIFKILKRGKKLKLGGVANEDELADLALRFDLTMPLCRFYSANKSKLPNVFKSLQMGYVFRAERPGKGRYRAFKQCDIDIIGEQSEYAEIELLTAAYDTFTEIGLKNLVFKINDRRFLKELMLKSGFKESELDTVAISLDKIDKIGEEKVTKELLSKNLDEKIVEKFIELNNEINQNDLNSIEKYSKEAFLNINSIIKNIKKINPEIKIEFDKTLVRGMGYYTSSIFEVFHSDLNQALGGGGRYDDMIGEFFGEAKVASVGFSIGYERLLDILIEKKVEQKTEKSLAILYSKEDDDIADVFSLARKLRCDFQKVSTIEKRKKLSKQINRLKDYDYSNFMIYDKDEEEIKDL